MSYVSHDGLAYFKNKLTKWVNDNYLSKTSTGNSTIAGNVTFTNPITGDLDGKAKKDWRGQQIDSTYIKNISVNDNAGQIVYTKGDGSSNYVMIDLMRGATPSVVGRAGLVPAPAIAEMNYFLRGDGVWAVPTDIYVNQLLLTGAAETENKNFPILLSGTSGTPASKTNATVAYPSVVSVNPRTNALMASNFISKHPSYNRQNLVTSKVQYTLNFTDNVAGAGHNLGEIIGYIDTLANGGEHELGVRLFGNPNVQGTEEDYVFMGVGLSSTNVPYGHAPSTPLYTTLTGTTKRTVGTDIITRDWLNLNGSLTGLVHTTMDETIDGSKTFKKTVTINSGDNNNKAGIYVQGDSEIHGNEHVYGTETVNGKVTAGNGLEVTGNAKATTLTVTSGATVGTTLSVGGKTTLSGGLAVSSGTTTDTLTATNGATISGGATVATGNLTITSGGITANNGTGTFKTLSVTSGATVGTTLTANSASIGNGGLTVAGAASLNGGTTTTTLTASSSTTIGGNLTVSGTTTATGKITANGGVQTTNLNATGDTTLKNLSVTSNTNVKNLKITSGGSIVNQDGNEYVTTIVNNSSTRNTVVSAILASNGGLEKDSNNKIKVKAGNGITVNSNGVNIDFAALKENNEGEFNKLMESFADAQRISKTGGKNQFYVDGENGSDNTDPIIDPNDNTKKILRGDPKAPFKTIQACVNYITKIYNFHNVSSYINCKNITASNNPGNLTLPNYNRTTASITVRAATWNNDTARNEPTTGITTNDIKINYTPDGNDSRFAVSVTGTGTWKLRNFDVTITDAGVNASGGHLAALSVGDSSTADLMYCKFTMNRSSNNPEYEDNTTGEHVIYSNGYGHIDIGPCVTVVGGDFTNPISVTDPTTNETTVYNRKLHGLYIVGNSSLQINDTRDQSNEVNGVDKRLVFIGNFYMLIGCSAQISRNKSYFGKANTDGVTKADYRFYIYSGGQVAIEESGKIDADHNDPKPGSTGELKATDTWLDQTTDTDPYHAHIADSRSYVQTATYSWYN